MVAELGCKCGQFLLAKGQIKKNTGKRNLLFFYLLCLMMQFHLFYFYSWTQFLGVFSTD